MGKLLREAPRVEYIDSISHPGVSMVIVRFYVGTKEEDASIRTYNKLYSNFDRILPEFHNRLSRYVPSITFRSWCSHFWGQNYDSYSITPRRSSLLGSQQRHTSGALIWHQTTDYSS